MLALLSSLDLVYMLGSMLAATLLKIVALPVPLLRQVFWTYLPTHLGGNFDTFSPKNEKK